MMAGLFSQDSPLARTLDLLASVAVVSMCLLLTALPLVTFGAGLAAAHRVLIQIANDEGSHPWRTFWHVFRKSFPIGFLAWLCLLFLAMLSAYELWILTNAETHGFIEPNFFTLLLRSGIIAALILLGIVAVWFFALLGQSAAQENQRVSFMQILRLAVYSGFRYLHLSLLALVLWVVPIIVAIIYPQIGVRLIFFYLVFIPGFTLYLISLAIGTKVRALSLHLQ